MKKPEVRVLEVGSKFIPPAKDNLHISPSLSPTLFRIQTFKGTGARRLSAFQDVTAAC